MAKGVQQQEEIFHSSIESLRQTYPNWGQERWQRRLERKLPDAIGRTIRRLRDPALRWVRIPIGILLILGGLLSFLPVLGLWMLPLGFLLLAQDLAFLRRPTGRALVWLERRWAVWKSAFRRFRS